MQTSWAKGPCLWVRRPQEQCGLTFVVRRKLGCAVARNRLRRRLRHICREDESRPGGLVVMAQAPAMEASFAALRDEFRDLVARL
ncbi:MAG: ribonuclease P protein component [Candidatus Latescibacterota bacterium]